MKSPEIFRYVPKELAPGEKKPKPRFNPDKEVREFNKSWDFNIHDPYRDHLKNLVNVPGSDVVDPENYYNKAGFENFKGGQEIPNNPIDDSERDGVIGGVVNRYGLKNLEEWELEKLMKDCELISFVDESKRGEATEMLMKKYEIEGVEEWRADDLVEEMASLYRPYLAVKNEKESAFNNKGLERLSENDLEKLADLHGEKSELTFKIAEINGLIKNPTIEAVSTDPKTDPKIEEEAIIAKLSYAYSTAKEENSEINKQGDLKKKGPNITLKPEVALKREQEKKRDELADRLKEVEKEISIIKEPIRERAEQIKIIDAENEIKAWEAEEQVQKDNKQAAEDWKNLPEYNEKDQSLREKVLAYIKKEDGARKPTFEKGEKLSQEQIEDVLREIAKEKGWAKGNFYKTFRKFTDKDGNLQNIRQLMTVDNTKDGKRIKYIFESENLPAGQYFYDADPKLYFVSKKDPKSAIAMIRFFISTERPKKSLPDDIVARMAKVAAEKPAAAKAEIKIVKKGDKEKQLPHVINKKVEKPAPTIIKNPGERPRFIVNKKLVAIDKSDKPAPVIKKKVSGPTPEPEEAI